VTTPEDSSPCVGAWAGINDLAADVAVLHGGRDWCRFLGLASSILWAATGRRWRGAGRTAEAVLRAAPPRLGEESGWPPTWPYHSSWGVCVCGTVSGLPRQQITFGGHPAPMRVRLPHPDVTAVTELLVDGDPFTAWRLDGAWLTRTDGCGWAVCGDSTEVTYAYGIDPPDGGVLAAAELAGQLGIAAAGDTDLPCRLPARTRSVSRQGISMDITDPMEFLDQGLTGLYAVDAWIRAVNPYGRRQAGRVWSPDLARARRTR
jgi:hypothetical protein